MSYLKDNARFAGTGERDANGYTLDEFLNSYDPRKYDSPCNTVDMLVFRSKEPYRRKDQPLKLLLIKRKNHPSIGFWATPGGFADVYENLEDSAKRELLEETGVSGIPLIQLGTWGDYDRDPRWRIITTAYLALVEGDLAEHAGDDAADAAWFDAKLVPTESMPSAGDSKQIPTEKKTPAGAGAEQRLLHASSGLPGAGSPSQRRDMRHLGNPRSSPEASLQPDSLRKAGSGSSAADCGCSAVSI